MEERYKQVDEKISGFDSLPEEIKVILDKYIDVFDTKLRKSMNVEPVQLNVKEGSKPYACFSCRPTPVHYRETGEKLVKDLLDQRIIQRCGSSRSEYCAPAHFVEKPGRVPLALRLVVDFTRLNEQLIRDQPQVFPTGEEIRQQLGADCCVWICLDALAAYFQIKVRKEDRPKTTFMLHSGRYFFRKTVMGNRLSSDTWLRASDEVIEGLEGVYKLVDDLIIGGKDYVQLAERLEALLTRCRKAGMTLASNKVQVGSRVSFAGYIIDGTTQYPDPKKVDAVTQFPLPTTQKELRGWMGLCNQLNHYVPGLAGEQAEFRKLLKKNVTFTVTEKMRKEFEAAKEAMGKNILLNAFDAERTTLVITDASADGFGHILMQKKNKNEIRVKAQRSNREGTVTNDTGWVVIQVGSAAIKAAWRNYSALELEATCVVWSLETLAYYLKGCPEFDLWSDHAPLAQAMKKEVRELTPRMQKFCEAIQAYNVRISFVKGIHNHISDALSRSPVGGAERVEAILRRLRGHASYAYNRVVSCIKGDICKEVI